jgi:hypothetical protein
MEALTGQDWGDGSDAVVEQSRDEELVRFVGRHGLVAMRHVMAALGVGRTAAYRRVSACVEGGLLERLYILRSEAGLLRATRAGLSYAGLGLPLASVSPGNVDHLLRCTTVAQRAEARYGADRVLSERELRLAEQVEGRRIASAELGEDTRGPRMHRADLAVFAESGPAAIEIELTPKSAARLRQLMRAWRWGVAHGEIKEVHYLCAPGRTRSAVERAVEYVQADGLIVVGEAPSR